MERRARRRGGRRAAGREPRGVPHWVLDLLDHAEVLAPPELRADMVAWLDATSASEPESRRERAAVSPRAARSAPRLARVLALVPCDARASRRHDRRARGALRGGRARARARPRAAADVRAAAVHRRPAHRRVGDRRRRSRSGSPSTSNDRCASRRPKVSRCSPPDARCSRSPAPTPTGPLATALGEARRRVGAPGSLAVDVGASDQLERLQRRGRDRRAASRSTTTRSRTTR